MDLKLIESKWESASAAHPHSSWTSKSTTTKTATTHTTTMKTTTMKTTTMTMEPTTTNNETTKTNVRLPTHPFLSWTSKSSSLQGQFHSDCSQDRSLRFVRYGGDGLVGLVAKTDVNTKCQVLD